jgi:hypothetical protein
LQQEGRKKEGCQMADMVDQRNWKTITAWILIVVVWVCTPFIGDRIPTWVAWAYCLFSPAAVIFGLYVAWTKRSVFLGIASILTIFSWLIILVVGLALFGI